MTVYIRNYIDESERRFNEAVYVTSLGGLWSSDQTLNSDPTVYLDAEFGSLRAEGASEVNVYFNIWGDPSYDIPSQFAVTDFDDADDGIESFVWIRPTKDCTIYVQSIITKVSYDAVSNKYLLSTNPADVIEGEFGSRQIRYGADDAVKWVLVRANRLAVPSSPASQRYSIGVRVRIVYDSEVGIANVARPTITMLNDLFLNNFSREVVGLIPEVFLAQDFIELDNTVSFPLARLIDVSFATAGTVEDKYEASQYLDSESDFDPNDSSTYSTLISAETAETLETLQWLSHFRGRELLVTYEPSTNGEEWTEFVLDESELDSTHVLASSAISSSGFSGGTDGYFRWQVETGFYGHNAGTITAMISAIQLLLSETKTVSYTVGTNEITFETKIGETFASDVLGLIVGDENPYILQVIEPARPLGMVIHHELVA
jgi:hypothetical protein